MNSAYTPYTPYTAAGSPSVASAHSPAPETPTPTPGRGRPRGALTGTGAKRGRKPRGGSTLAAASPRPFTQDSPVIKSPAFPNLQFALGNWATSTGQAGTGSGTNVAALQALAASLSAGTSSSYTPVLPQQSQNAASASASSSSQPQLSTQALQTSIAFPSITTPSAPMSLSYTLPSGSTIPSLDTSRLISMTGANLPRMTTATGAFARPPGGDDDGDGDDDLLPAMADDDYSAQLSWQSQSKDNLKCVAPFLSPFP